MAEAENTYEQQLSEKVERLNTRFACYGPPALEIFPSAAKHYRMRAEFRVWHDGDDLYHIMFDQNTKQKIRVDQFEPASETINKLMGDVIAQIRPHDVLRRKLFQIDYLTALSGEVVISLLYHRQLDEQWVEAATTLKQRLGAHREVSIIGRAKKQKHIIGNDFVIERLPINGQHYVFKHIENSFTQPNAQVNCKMIEWAIDCSQGLEGDLVEFYCGAGNFSIPLAPHFNNVIGTEIAKPSVEAAHYNIQENQIDNVRIVRLSAEEFTSAMRGDREFNRLKGIDLTRYKLTTALVDPPRSGLDNDTLNMVKAFDAILYISCNPETLYDNLQTLTQTHRIERFALFDQFPFTHHVESGVLLIKKP
ncbi:tRNA (uridine(54)-C5)-methyltransferase TrmA [Alteromonas sp. SM 2104]|nr:tRNA (uridine(54)-C5)-methyltransferase TrmA [Alteromonas oceanisediminis]MBT0585845.1 tRNA (uridine(54)-C5)-methyltransferase TrmA [Alteromonas oceanisediminis]